MIHKILLGTIVFGAILSSGIFCDSQAEAQVFYTQQSPDLFYNYRIPPTAPNMIGASMYPCPNSSIPPHVGHTYYTYQPLMPHEFMYKHSRTYWRCHPDGSRTRTRVIWK